MFETADKLGVNIEVLLVALTYMSNTRQSLPIERDKYTSNSDNPAVHTNSNLAISVDYRIWKMTLRDRRGVSFADIAEFNLAYDSQESPC